MVGVGSKTKVADGKVVGAFLHKHNIFRLEVSVNDSLVVHFLQSTENVPEDFPFVALGSNLVVPESLVELSALQKLQNDINGVLGLEHSFESVDVGVVKLAHEGDLIDERLLAKLS